MHSPIRTTLAMGLLLALGATDADAWGRKKEEPAVAPAAPAPVVAPTPPAPPPPPQLVYSGDPAAPPQVAQTDLLQTAPIDVRNTLAWVMSSRDHRGAPFLMVDKPSAQAFVFNGAGELVADRQLARFRDDPASRGRTLRSGLWAWTRHPNYFFEWLHWFAYVPLAATGPHGWLALTGPVLMFAFLMRRGIPWSEAQALRSRGDDYRLYQREVGAFFPRPPRQSRR